MSLVPRPRPHRAVQARKGPMKGLVVVAVGSWQQLAGGGVLYLPTTYTVAVAVAVASGRSVCGLGVETLKTGRREDDENRTVQ